MWDLPRPGLEPVSPALAGGFLTTAPPGKPPALFNKDHGQETQPAKPITGFCPCFLLYATPLHGQALPVRCLPTPTKPWVSRTQDPLLLCLPTTQKEDPTSGQAPGLGILPELGARALELNACVMPPGCATTGKLLPITSLGFPTCKLGTL